MGSSCTITSKSGSASSVMSLVCVSPSTDQLTRSFVPLSRRCITVP